MIKIKPGRLLLDTVILNGKVKAIDSIVKA